MGCGDLRTLMCAGTTGINDVQATPDAGFVFEEPRTLAIIVSGSYSNTDPFVVPSFRVY